MAYKSLELEILVYKVGILVYKVGTPTRIYSVYDKIYGRSVFLASGAKLEHVLHKSRKDPL